MPGPPHGFRPPWAGRPWPRVPVAVGLAVVQVVGTVGAAHGQHDPHRLGPLAVLLLLAGPAVLLALTGPRRVPAVTAGVGAVTAAYLLLGYPYGPVFLSLVLVIVVAVAAGHRVVAWIVSAGVLLAHALATLALTTRRWSWPAEVAAVAWVLLVLAFAEVVRVRRERTLSLRQAMAEQRRRQAGEERLRIAQELHDVVAHHMSLINVQASVALHLADRRPEQVEDSLRVIKDASKEALTELRSLIGVLRDDDGRAPRSPAASLAALTDLVERSRYAGLDVTTRTTGEPRPLPAATELAAYRIIQEAVTNVVRHARAHRADIIVGYGADIVTVQVEDDGAGGRGIANVNEGNGIRGMRERATALGGTFSVAASPLGGVRVLAAIPTGEQR